MTTLPVINLSCFLLPSSSSTESDRIHCAKSIHNAILQFGFFYITGIDSVFSQNDFSEILAAGRAFFHGSPAQKESLRIRPGDGARGYQRLGENVTSGKSDSHEGLDIYCPVTPEDPTKLMQGPNLIPPELIPVTTAWIEGCKLIGMALMKATSLGLGIREDSDEWKALEASVRESFYVMRYIGYPTLDKDAEGISCGAHKDYGCWTILAADDTPGALQVFLHDEEGDCEERGVKGRWLNADPIPHSFVVNIGEMWETWTNSLYKATLHRVIHQGLNYRVSIPFFYEPAFDAIVAPLPTAVALQTKSLGYAAPLKPAIVYGDFLSSKVSGNFSKSIGGGVGGGGKYD